MENVVKKTLILLSVITGLLFTASLCYSLVIGYSVRFGNDPPAQLNATATAIEMETTQAAAGETASPSIVVTPTSNQVATNVPAVDAPSKELTWNGLKIEVANVNYDAWPLVKAQNQFNQPPLEGMTMLLVTVRVSNFEGSTDGTIKLVDSDFQLVGSRGIAYKTYQVSCGVVPDRLSSVVALGGSTEATACFQVPVDERDFQLIYEPFGLPAVYFDLPESESKK